jgi:hypothetical protein
MLFGSRLLLTGMLTFFLLQSGCITPGGRIAVGRVEVSGRLLDVDGNPMPGQPIVLIQPGSMKTRKQEIDSAFDRPVRPNYYVRRQDLITDEKGEFHHLFTGFSRDEPFMVIPPFSFMDVVEPVDPALLILVKTPVLGRLYEINVKEPDQVRIYDPEIGSFRQPGKEWAEERIVGKLERTRRQLPDNPAYTQRVDHLWIQIETGFEPEFAAIEP